MGIILLLAGIAQSWILAAVGIVIAVVCGLMWTRRAAAGGELLKTGEIEEVAEEPQVPRRTPLEQDEHVGLEEAEPEKEKHTRRNVILLGAATLGLSQVVGVLVTVPVLGFMVLPPFLDQGFEDQDVGPLDDFPEGEWIVTTFMADERQGAVSRLTTFIRNNGFLGDLPSFTILSSHCAHLGCPIQPQAKLNSDPKQFENVTLISLDTPPSGFGCPCHGGAYDTEGRVTAGPPVRPLDRYSFSIRNGHLYLGAPFSVSKVTGSGADAKILKWPLSYPGEPTGGLDSWLYPIQPPHN